MRPAIPVHRHRGTGTGHQLSADRRVTKRSIRLDDQGASAVEYGLIVFAIAAVIALVVFSLGGVVHSLFQNSCNTIKDGIASSASCGP